MPSTLRWRCSPIHSSARQNSPKSRVQRQPGLARHLPVADRPVDLLLFLPGDEGVAQQRGDVVGDRAADRVLEVEDAGVGRRRPSGCAASSRGAPRPSAGPGRSPPGGRRRRPRSPVSRRVQVAPHSRATHQSGKSASSRRSSASSYGGSAARRDPALPDDEGGDGVAHQRVGPAGVARGLRRPAAPRGRARCRDRRGAGSRASGSASRTRGACRPACAIRPATWTKGRTSSCGGGASMTTTLPPPCEVGAQVAAKAGIARRRPQAGDDQAARRRRPRRARRRRRSLAPGRPRRIEEGSGEEFKGGGDRRSRCERASLVDNRFYKSMRDRLCQAVRLRILSIAVLAVLAGGAAAQAPTPAASAPAQRVERVRHRAAQLHLAAAAAARRRRQAAADHPAGARGARPARPRRRSRRRRRVPPRRGRHPLRPAELRPGRGPRPRHAATSSSAARATSSSARSCSSRSSASKGSFAPRPIASPAPMPAARRR